MTLLDEYNAAVKSGEINHDEGQREVLVHLQRVADELRKSSAWYGRWRTTLIKGVYLHGPVGVGKTYLGDLFYQQVSHHHKARFHFHHFMQQIDAKLRSLQGKKDPLKQIAKQLAKKIKLLCFDEFMVYDVAYAMILAELLQALFKEGIVLVATSNIPPDKLYLNGPQRDRFLPAIELIQEHCEVLTLAEKRDYRLGRTPLQHAYLFPLDQKVLQIMSEQFSAIASNIQEGLILSVQNRMIPSVKCSDRAVWFQFDNICNMPRSQLDYLEIADRFDTVFLSDIPSLTKNDTLKVILFIHFIDVMYDRGIQLVISAARELKALYVEGEMVHEFQRTLSRLEEMQSADYGQRHQRRLNSSF